MLECFSNKPVWRCVRDAWTFGRTCCRRSAPTDPDTWAADAWAPCCRPRVCRSHPTCRDSFRYQFASRRAAKTNKDWEYKYNCLGVSWYKAKKYSRSPLLLIEVYAVRLKSFKKFLRTCMSFSCVAPMTELSLWTMQRPRRKAQRPWESLSCKKKFTFQFNFDYNPLLSQLKRKSKFCLTMFDN